MAIDLAGPRQNWLRRFLSACYGTPRRGAPGQPPPPPGDTPGLYQIGPGIQNILAEGVTRGFIPAVSAGWDTAAHAVTNDDFAAIKLTWADRDWLLATTQAMFGVSTALDGVMAQLLKAAP